MSKATNRELHDRARSYGRVYAPAVEQRLQGETAEAAMLATIADGLADAFALGYQAACEDIEGPPVKPLGGVEEAERRAAERAARAARKGARR